MFQTDTDRAPRINELRFQYQPIVSLADGDPGWAEALVRWHLADGTIRGPLDVLPHWLGATRHPVFTRFSIERAAASLAAHPSARISVNLSPTQITHPTTLQLLEGLLPNIRSRLRIELTEQHFYDTAALWSSLALVRERCEVVLLDDVTLIDIDSRAKDDAPIDGVKLDRSVIQQLEDPARRPIIERFVRSVTERFPIVVAEGIEDRIWCEGLQELGVSHVQGFGIGRPQPDLVEPLYEPQLPRVLATPARGVRLNFGAILAGGVHSELTD